MKAVAVAVAAGSVILWQLVLALSKKELFLCPQSPSAGERVDERLASVAVVELAVACAVDAGRQQDWWFWPQRLALVYCRCQL